MKRFLIEEVIWKVEKLIWFTENYVSVYELVCVRHVYIFIKSNETLSVEYILKTSVDLLLIGVYNAKNYEKMRRD
jgi:hypothetical protein